MTPSASQVPDPARGATPQGDLQVSGRHHRLSPAEIAAMEEKRVLKLSPGCTTKKSARPETKRITVSNRPVRSTIAMFW